MAQINVHFLEDDILKGIQSLSKWLFFQRWVSDSERDLYKDNRIRHNERDTKMKDISWKKERRIEKQPREIETIEINNNKKVPNRETERDGEKDKDRVKEERRKAKINQTRDGTKGNENRAPVRKREMKRLNDI